jgi:hypothetical protein
MGAFTMGGDAVISRNKASNNTDHAAHGGGVIINGGSFTMNGGTIYGQDNELLGNTSKTSGAVFYKRNGTHNLPADVVENTLINGKFVE